MTDVTTSLDAVHVNTGLQGEATAGLLANAGNRTDHLAAISGTVDSAFCLGQSNLHLLLPFCAHFIRRVYGLCRRSTLHMYR